MNEGYATRSKKKNQRNFYRTLFVQPDAPMEIVQASYRVIMQKLKAHPDLGGDVWNASIINEAYETLIDPDRRAAYDKHLFAGNSKKILGLQSDAQRAETINDRTDDVAFSGSWEAFRPRTL